MKNNFTTPNPFVSNKSNYSNMLDSYTNLVNQPTKLDAYADVFADQAKDMSSQGAMNQAAKGAMASFGAGIKGAANSQRQEKLSPIMQQTAQIVAKEAELTAQMQEEKMHQGQVRQVFRQAAPIIKERSRASMAGDTQAVSKMDKGILDIYKQIMKDPSVGDYSHSNDGSLYYTNNDTGVIEGRNPIHLMYQAGINPAEFFGQDAPMIEASYSPGAKLNYENTLEVNRLALEKERAGIANQYSQANYHNAQTQGVKQEMNAPKYNKGVADHNLEYLKEARGSNLKNEALADTLGDLIKYVELAKKEGAAGATPLASLTRKYQKITGSDKNATLAEMLKQVYFARVKEVGGSNPSGYELKVALDTMPSIDKNPDAALTILKRDKEAALKNIFKYKRTEEALRNSNYQMSPDDQSILANSERDFQDFLDSRGNRPTTDAQQGMNKNTHSNDDFSDLL